MPLADKLFNIRIEKGHLFKGIVDVLQVNLTKTTLRINENGMSICQVDPTNRVFYDFDFHRDNYPMVFNSKREIEIEFKTKNLQGLTRSIKKKDSIEIFMEKGRRSGKDELCVNIIPPGGGESEMSGENEIVKTPVSTECSNKPQHVVDETCECEEAGEEFCGGEACGNIKSLYYNSKTVDSQWASNLKKLVSLGRKIDVKIQSTNYMSVYSEGTGGSSRKEHGRLSKSPEMKDGDEESTDENGYPATYDATFDSKLFSVLPKLASLSNTVSFSAPRKDKYPLKIQLFANGLGEMRIYINDDKTIRLLKEDSTNNDEKS